MEKVIIAGYSEIALKGKNRGYFERKLMDNISKCLKWNKCKSNGIKKVLGRIYVYTDWENTKYLKKVFSIHSMRPALKVDFEHIKEGIDGILKGKKFSTFRVTAQRMNKKFEKRTNDIHVEYGSYIVEKYKAKVSLEKQDVDVHIEVSDAAYISIDRVIAFGGLPVGSQGTCSAIIDSEESILAAILVMKRGAIVEPILKKKISLKLIEDYYFEKLTPVKSINYDAVVVGDTYPNLTILPQTVLRPLIGMGKEEIAKIKKCYF